MDRVVGLKGEMRPTRVDTLCDRPKARVRANSFDLLRRVDTETRTSRFRGLLDQAGPLVEADRLDTNARPAGGFSDVTSLIKFRHISPRREYGGCTVSTGSRDYRTSGVSTQHSRRVLRCPC